MRLLLYSHFFAPSVGGVETILVSLARGLAGLRTREGAPQFEVTVVTETPAKNFDDRSLGFSVVRRPSLQHLWRLIRSANVVHIAGPSLAPLLLARLERKPVVVEHHGYQSICPNGLLLQQPNRSLCPGHFQARNYRECWRCQAAEMPRRQTLVRMLLMFPRNKLTRAAARNIAITPHVLARHALPRSSVIYYGIEDIRGSEFLPAAPDRANSPDPEKMRFAYVGRFVPEKGLPILLAAAQILLREHFQFELLLIGDGPERLRLEAAIAHAHLADVVRITGFLQGASLAKELDAVRVVVMPSVWEETAGLAAIEQMMRGRPVIASKIGGLGEVVGDAGLLCEPGDAQDLARCMRQVLQDPAILSVLGRKARQRALSLFLRERMIADHANVYLELAPHPAR